MPISFIGPSYQLDDRKADVQRSINLMPTLIESGTGKTDVFLEPVPGLTVFSVPQEIYYVIVTSRPYAVLVLDELDTGANLLRGFIYGIIDYLDAGVTIVGGTLRPLLILYQVPVEEVNANLTIVSGTLLVKLILYQVPVEEMNGNLTIVSGTLLVKLINYTNWPVEPMDANLTIVSGTLV